jgi:hypothetical protein
VCGAERVARLWVRLRLSAVGCRLRERERAGFGGIRFPRVRHRHVPAGVVRLASRFKQRPPPCPALPSHAARCVFSATCFAVCARVCVGVWVYVSSIDLGPMGASHAVLPFMGRHNPFIQPVAGAAPPLGSPTGTVAAPSSGVALPAPAKSFASAQSQQQPQQPQPQPQQFEAPPLPQVHGQSGQRPASPSKQQAAAAAKPQRLVAGSGSGAAPLSRHLTTKAYVCCDAVCPIIHTQCLLRCAV